MCDQRTREPATSEQRIGQGSLSALRAISACISESAFLACCFAPSVSLSESAVPCGSLCSITPPLKGGGVEWSRKETDKLLHLLHWSSLEHGAKVSAFLTHFHFRAVLPSRLQRTGNFLRISYRCIGSRRASGYPSSRQLAAPIAPQRLR